MIKRRHFFKIISGALGAGVVFLQSGIAAAKKMAIGLDKVPTLRKIGGTVKLKLSGKEILFVRESDKQVRAVDAKCSHQSCPVKFNSDKGQIECACHGSKFKLDGSLIKGPASKPLKVYSTTLSGDKIIVDVD